MLEIIRKIKIIDGVLAGGIFLVAIGIGVSVKDSYLKKPEAKVEVIRKPTEVQVDNKVVIDIAGEVIHPGVYKLKKGDRVGDVLNAAGGLSASADREWVEQNINKAELVRDGEKIYIPKLGEKLASVSNLLINKGNIVSLNNASVEELDKLDGIGPSIAQRIIDYRTKNGDFKSVEEIKLVPGIGDKLFEKIKDEVTL